MDLQCAWTRKVLTAAMTGVAMTLLALAALSAAAQERGIGGIGLTLFADANFRGKSATLRRDAPSLASSGLDNHVSSLRVGPGERWEVCELASYRGRCVVVWGEESNLRDSGWNNVISSARRVSDSLLPDRPEPPPKDWYLVLYDQPMYRGTPVNYRAAASSLGGYHRRAQSVTIGRGVWDLCEGPRFTGRCVTLDRSVADLGALGLRRNVASLRPTYNTVPSRPTPPDSDWYVVLFDQPLYRGHPVNFKQAMPSLGRYSRRAQSVTIGEGVWELCEQFNYRGRCVTLDNSVPDLSVHGLQRRVSSLRPVRPQPR